MRSGSEPSTPMHLLYAVQPASVPDLSVSRTSAHLVLRNQAAEPKLCSSGVTMAKISSGDLPVTLSAPNSSEAYSAVNYNNTHKIISHHPHITTQPQAIKPPRN